jgi:uncharacterized protein (DUF433 family)
LCRRRASECPANRIDGLREALANRVETATIRSVMTASDRIIIDPAICHGKPVIRGSRVPVTIVVGSLAGGMSFDEIQREYDLSAEDIRAALKFAGELVEQESFYPLPAG